MEYLNWSCNQITHNRRDIGQFFHNLLKGYELHGVCLESEMPYTRRFDPDRRSLSLSELLTQRSRSFQLAHQLALREHGELLDAQVVDARLTTDVSRALARVTTRST